MKEKLKTFFTRENIVAFTVVIGVAFAGYTIYQTRVQLKQNQSQLDIAKEQIAVPQFVEAIKLLERDSYRSKKVAIKMLENLVVNNSKYTEQSLNILLGITSKYMRNKECSTDIMKKLKNAKNDTQEELVNKVLSAIANILKKSKNLNLTDAWLCGLKISNDKNINIFANFNHAKLQYSKFKNIDFSYSNLNNADFRNAILENIDFSDGFNKKEINSLNFDITERLTGIKFFATEPIEIENGTETVTRYIPDFICNKASGGWGIDGYCPPKKEEYEKTIYKPGITGKNQTRFYGKILFMVKDEHDIDFGCNLDKGKLSIILHPSEQKNLVVVSTGICDDK